MIGSTDVTSVTPFRRKDVTGALRVRRYRRRKNGKEIKPAINA
jgi:hypothetical protein